MALSKNPEAKARQLSNLRPFRKGSAPISPGRPAVARDFREMCREWTTTEGFAKLKALGEDPTSRFHFQALELLMAYGLGRPPQETKLTGETQAPFHIIVTYDKPKAPGASE